MSDCINHLTIIDPEQDLQAFSKAVIGEAPAYAPLKSVAEPPRILNFHSVVPVPANLLDQPRTEGGADWELENWGCGGAVDDITSKRLPDGSLHYRFVTYDAPPKRWLETASKRFPTLSFELEYFNLTCDGHGEFKVRNGIVESDTEVCWHEEDDEQPPVDLVTRIRRSLGFSD